MPTSRIKEAFMQSPNLIGLAVCAATSMAQLNPVPLLVGAVAEAAYLLFVPDTPWIRAKVDRKNRAEEDARRAASRKDLLGGLRGDLHERFDRLAARRDQIQQAMTGDPSWASADLLPNLDYLLDKYLVFASKEAQYRNYLQAIRDEATDSHVVKVRVRSGDEQAGTSSDPTTVWTNQVVDEAGGRYGAARKQLQAEIEKEQDPDARALLEKRDQVLERRQEYLNKAAKALINIHRQLTLLEDAFGLINDEIRVRPPEQIQADLEGVLNTTETMTQSLDEMAAFEQSLSAGAQV